MASHSPGLHRQSIEGPSEVPSALIYAPHKAGQVHPLISRLVTLTAAYPGHFSQSDAGPLLGISPSMINRDTQRLAGRLGWIRLIREHSGGRGAPTYRLSATTKFREDRAVIEAAAPKVDEYIEALAAFKVDYDDPDARGDHFDAGLREKWLGAAAILGDRYELPSFSPFLKNAGTWDLLIRTSTIQESINRL